MIKKTLIFLILFISSLKAESVFPIDPADEPNRTTKEVHVSFIKNKDQKDN